MRCPAVESPGNGELSSGGGEFVAFPTILSKTFGPPAFDLSGGGPKTAEQTQH